MMLVVYAPMVSKLTQPIASWPAKPTTRLRPETSTQYTAARVAITTR
jgi:hypothetical protein